MEYRITVRSNPRVIGIVFIIVGLPGIGVAAFFLWSPIAGIIIALIGGFFAYNFLKLVRSILGSSIRTGEDAVVFDFGKGHTNVFEWDDIDFAGTYLDESGKPMLFVYNEDEDSLITVPDEYERFDDLVGEIGTALGDRFKSVELEKGETINDYLKRQMDLHGPGPGSAEREEDELSETEKTSAEKAPDTESDDATG